MATALTIKPLVTSTVPSMDASCFDTMISVGSSKESCGTISKLFIQTAKKFNEQTAFTFVQPEETDDTQSANRKFSVLSCSWTQYLETAKVVAKALIAQGVAPRDTVTMQGANSPQWLFSYVGSILAAGISAGIYPTNGGELCDHIVKSSGAKVAFVENEEQLNKYRGMQSSALKCIVVWNKIKGPIQDCAIPVLSWDDFLRTGETVSDGILAQRVEMQIPQDPCALIFTSGTTGRPKAATLTHKNLIWTGESAGKKFLIDHEHRGLSFLPLSHIASQLIDCVLPLICGQPVDIASADALKGTNLRQYIVHTKPTYFLAVPRVWEKFKEAIEAKVVAASFLKRKMFSVCSRIGRRIVPDYSFLTEKKASSSLSLLEKIRYTFERFILSILERKIFGPIKGALGLDRCKIVASGAGAMDQKVRDFFDGINLHVLDVYGMSESTGPAALPDGITPSGSCGKQLSGTQITIANPDEKGDGEILVKGPNVFAGYWKDEESTKSTIDGDGFLHTGDKGRLDKDGNLFITGRIKELIKTSGGENIPPLRIEDRIRAQLPIVSHAVTIGDGWNFLTCLLTLKTEPDGMGNPTERLTSEVITTLRGVGSSATTLKEASEDLKVQQFLMQGIQRANQQADSQAQHIRKIKVLSEDFSIPNGMMTPTLKLRRSMIAAKYQKEIVSMYAVHLSR